MTDGTDLSWDGPAGAAAVVGLSCLLPAAPDWPRFRDLLMEGRDAIRDVPAARWDWRRHHGTRGAAGAGVLPRGASATRRGGFLDVATDLFDHAYFAISPREARLMDPQQRLLLQQVVHCLEDAGMAPEALRAPRRRTSVHVGFMSLDHMQAVLDPSVAPDGQASLGAAPALLANRISHAFGFGGESVALDAACASSLVALHQARRALAAGECDAAIVAGVSLLLSPWRQIAFSQARMLSPQGRCATFDAAADGYVAGEGLVVLLLRRPADARREGLRVHGILRGSATGHVGATRTVTAPSLAAQRAVIEAAAHDAGIGLDTVTYVEAHGTGTALGDPIEIEALRQAFSAAGAAPGGCLVGSVKTNIGHLEPTAGLAGVAKVLLMLREKRIAPTLHLHEPNPLIDFADGPLRPATTATAWLPASPGLPRRAGVSAFGYGGALAHVIVEEAPPAPPPLPTPDLAWPILFSAHSATAFAALWRAWRDAAAGALPPLADIAATLARGRPALGLRAVIMAGDAAVLRAGLAADPAPTAAASPPRIALRLGTEDAVMADAVDELLALARPGTPRPGDPAERRALAARLIRDAVGSVARVEAAGSAIAEAEALSRADPAIAPIPLLDRETGLLHHARSPDAAYLSRLRDALGATDPKAAAALLARAAILVRTNATFAGYIADWQRALPREAAPIATLFAEPGTPESGPWRLALLAAAASLCRLEAKWDLPARHAGLGAAWSEAATLIAAGALTEPAAAAWLDGADPAALTADTAGRHLPRDIGPLPLLDAAPPLPASAAAPVDVTILLGEIGASGEDILTLDPKKPTASLLAILGELWRRGATVAWDLLPGRVADAPLPAYPFDPHRHALPIPPLPAAPGGVALATEHVIGGRALLPAAAMALSLAEAAGEGARALRDLEFRRRVDAAEGVTLDARRDADGLLAIEDAAGATVALAEMDHAAPPTLPPNIAEGTPIAASDAYALLAGRRHAYGPLLQVIRAAKLGEAGLGAVLATRGDGVAALDGALQACLIAALRSGIEGEGPLLPAAIARLWLRGDAPPDRLDADVPLATLQRLPNGFVADVALRDEAGAPWAVATGVRFVGIGTEAPGEALRALIPDWAGQPDGVVPEDALVIGRGSGIGPRLAALMPRARLATTGDEAQGARDIFLLSPLDHPATPEPGSTARFLAEVVAPLRQWLAARVASADPAAPCHIRLVTAGRHAVLPGEAASAPLAAMVAALGKAAAREAGPALRVTTVDLQEAPTEADLAALAACAPGPLEEVAIRRGGAFALGLRPAAPAAPEAPPGAGGVQVIAGGAGGLGRLVALELARREGARIALLGRRADPPGISATLAALREAGAPEARYIAVDIADADAAEAALEALRRDWGPVRGVVQAAMVLSDLRLGAMDDAAFAAALAPKLAGTVNLLRATAQDAPGRFLCFSSALTLRGNAGQANYLAGCAAQDGLADWAASQGLPLRSLQWGLWAEVGRVGGRRQAARISATTGLLPLAPEAGLAAFAEALARPAPRLVLARLDAGWEGAIAPADDPWTGLVSQTGGHAQTDADTHAAAWADAEASALLVRALAGAGLLPAAGGEPEAAWRARLAAPLPRLVAPRDALAEMLLRHGAVRRDAAENIHAAALPEPGPTPAGCTAWAAAAAACIAGWPALLAGTAEGGDLLAPTGDPALLDALRASLPGDRAALQGFADLVATTVGETPGRVLHLGCGTGILTLLLAEALARRCGPDGTTLVATDRSAAMLAAAEARHTAAGIAGVTFTQIDPARPGSANDVPFDLVVAAGMAVPPPAVLAGFLAARLAPGGLVRLLLPATLADREIATLGLHEAAFAPRADAAAWRAALAGAGFDRIAVAQHPAWLHVLARRGSALPAALELPNITAPAVPVAASPLPPAPMPPARMPAPPAPDLLAAVIRAVAEVVEVEPAEIPAEARFLELGVDSLVAATVADRLRAALGIRLTVHVFADHPTIASLAGYLGKLAAPAEASAPPPARTPSSTPLDLLREAIATTIAVPAAEIEPDAPFAALGVDSVVAVEVATRLEAALGRRVPLHLFGDHPTPAALAALLAGEAPATPQPALPVQLAVPRPLPAPPRPLVAGPGVAIIGLAGRFPGAADANALWDMLEAGRSALGTVPPGRWTPAEHAVLAPGLDVARLARGGFIADAEAFDPAFFGLSPREAMAMDPQQRLLLEEGWKALTDAGLAAAPEALRRRTGVWVGAGTGDWALKLALSGAAPDRVSLVGQLGGSLAARLAHAFGLGGPAVTLDVACASAVAALEAAAGALQAGEVDLAVVGAVAVMATPQMPALAEAAGLLSASGRCAALGADADGMLLGEGVGVMVLRRMEDALAAGDAVHAVLRAARMGHDGGGGLGISTPSAAGQRRLAERVLAAAELPAAGIAWLEAHGVGTAAGDATELDAAAAVLGSPARRLAIGSAKPALGHGLAASGMAGAIKAVLQLRHGRLAPTAGLAGTAPAEAIRAAGMDAPDRAVDWPATDGPRRALVSVFALNGANGMMVIEEPPAAAASIAAVPGPRLLVLAGATEAGLRAHMAALAAWIGKQPLLSLADLARTLAEAAAPLPLRAALVARDAAEAAALLATAGAGRDGTVRIGQVRRRDAATAALLGGMAEGLLAKHGEDRAAALQAAAELFVAGVPMALPPEPGARRLTLLPPYPFARERFWPGAATTPAAVAAPAAVFTPAAALPHAASALGLLAEVLRLPAERIAADAAPMALGLDSLLALELRQRIAATLGKDVAVPAILGAADVAALEAAVAAAPVAAPRATALLHDAAGRHAPFPLTELQRAYFIGRSMALPLGGPCQAAWEFALRPGTDAARLEAALNALIAAHDALRTVVGTDGMQRVLPDVPRFAIARHDWRGLPDAEARRGALREEFAALSFDPARWPLFRVDLSEAADGMRLHLAFDLLILDMPSLVRLLDRWAALLADPAASPGAPPITFRDVVLAPETEAAAAARRSAEAFWAEEAQHLPPAPELPEQKPLDAGTLWRATRHEARLDAASWAGLRGRAAAAGVTPATAVLTAFAEVLSHWTRAPRFTLNLTVMDRPALHPAVGEVLGDFTHTLLLGLDLAQPMPFAQRAGLLRNRVAERLAHAAIGGVRVLRDMARAGAPAPLMPVVFTSMLGHGRDASAGGLHALGRLVGGITRTPQTWLDCHLHEDAEGGLALCWDARDELFPDGLIVAMFAAMQAALRRLATDDAAWSATLRGSIAAAEEARRAASNATAGPVPAGLLHEPFLRQALAWPDRVAVIAPDRTLTHGELLRHALAIADALAETPRDTLVAVVLPKGWGQVAAVLGTLIGGGAYLPLDPALPPERLRALIARGEARRIVTDSATEAALTGAWPDGVARIALDALAPVPLPASLPAPRARSDDLAYVIFTSGSTGEPKGVMIEHRAALNTVMDVNERFGIGPEDRTLALSALSFDLSVWDIFGVLGAGGAVVVPAARSIADPAHLADLVGRHRVTIWNSVPMFLQLLLEGAPAADRLASVRLVMLSGDWIPLTLPPRWRAVNAAAALVSLGGATEAAIWSIFHPVEHATRPGWPSVPYGRAMRNQDVHVLDDAMAPCPDMVPGELFIGGVGLARGYWRDAARTAERFVTHPRTGARLYRTGDTGRWREDGLIEFLGRRDGQVKIGGHRVELGEVEAVLARQPGVAQAVAVAPPDAAGRRRLVAFCVAPGASAEAIRAGAGRILPAYMVPAELRLLERLPRNANDKVDRRALEQLAAGAATDITAEPGPTDPAGRMLKIWREVLGTPALAATDNLFEAGATSFTAVQAVARIAREVAPCTVTDLFEFPSVAALATHLGHVAAPAPVVEPVTGTDPAADPAGQRAARRRAARAAAMAEDEA